MKEGILQQLIESFCAQIQEQTPFASVWIQRALRRVPRHLFIEQYYDYRDGQFTKAVVNKEKPTDDFLILVYSDRGLMIRDLSNHSAASQPSLVALMLHYLDLKPGMRVLEIGTGSGWNAGLLAVGAGDDKLVYSIDIQDDLVEEARQHLAAVGYHAVNLLSADGANGWPHETLFNRIMATVGCPDIPLAWMDQLADDGVLLVPLKTGPVGDPLLRLQRHGNSITGRFVAPSGFMTLQGAFWTNSEDALVAPWDSQVDELLTSEPGTVSLPHPIDSDVLFFAYLKGMQLRSLVDWQRMLGPDSYLLDQECGTIYVPDREHLSVKVYGDLTQARRWTGLIEEWIRLGKPRLTDFTVTVAPSQTAPKEGSGWHVERRHNLYRFTI